MSLWNNKLPAFRSISRTFLAVTLISLLTLDVAYSDPAHPAGAQEGRIYFSGIGIKRIFLDGTGLQEVTDMGATELAIDKAAGKLYWTYTGVPRGIWRANLDGSDLETLIGTTTAKSGIALDLENGKMYWTQVDSGDAIKRANLDGSAVETLLEIDDLGAIALDVAGGKMYWTQGYLDSARIQRGNLDGSNVVDVVTDPGFAVGLAIDPQGGKIYWADGYLDGRILRASLDGTNVEELVATPQPRRLALDLIAGKVYWTDQFMSGKIQRANLDGSGVETVLAGYAPFGIALELEEPPVCGDGVLDENEECDDGVNNSDTLPDACRTDCTLPTCGDGVVDSGEECDDGNLIDGDLCSANCEVEEACCIPDGSCALVPPDGCIAQGGSPQSPGTQCTAPEVCCLSDGSCVMVDPLCCDDLGGTPQSPGSICGGVEACCEPDGSCSMKDVTCCIADGGTPEGPGSVCLGDASGNGVDDACEEAPVPTVSEWGMAILTLLLLVGAKVYFGRRRACSRAAG